VAHKYATEHVLQEGMAMNAMTYSTVRANLAHTLEQVCNDHEPVIITRNNKQAVVLMSLEDYQAIEETASSLCKDWESLNH